MSFQTAAEVKLRKVWLVEVSETLEINGQEVIVHQPMAVYSSEVRARLRAREEEERATGGRKQTVVSQLWFEDLPRG